MDKEKARVLIHKINALYKNIDANTPGVSPLERDLMLSYLRQFYETIALSQSQNKAPVKEVQPEKEVKHIKEVEPIKEVQPEKEIQRVKEVQPDREMQPLNEVKRETGLLGRERGVANFELEKKIVEPVAPEITPQPAEPLSDSGLAHLFIWQEPSNLAERLASQAITNLSFSTFSMNERLLYTNDLFGKNSAEMEEAVKMINNFTHFDQAKVFLLNIGRQHDWHKEERKEAAKSFINTVRRRFL
ncbi:hypothetical protein LBMAG24_05240 [Bacteroidota bacterium]|nr:hypothetical protein LBMAG24_05240 [Bacteroidota bacterium]